MYVEEVPTRSHVIKGGLFYAGEFGFHLAWVGVSYYI